MKKALKNLMFTQVKEIKMTPGGDDGSDGGDDGSQSGEGG